MVADVSVEKEVNDFVSTVVSEFGGLDVVREQLHDLTLREDGCKCGRGCSRFDP